MNGFRLCLTRMSLCLLTAAAFAQNPARPVSLRYDGTGGYSLVERTNLRRYVNGKYVGLTSREVRSFISPAYAPDAAFDDPRNPLHGGQWYDGSFYVNEATKRNRADAAVGIHDSIPSVFHISPKGKLTMYVDNGYPSFRSFPAFTTEAVRPGDAWSAHAERSADPLNKGIFTRIPMEVAYTYVRQETYREQDVYRITAAWQTNYGANKRDPNGDPSLVKAAGGHKADILVRTATGEAILVVDTVDETFVYADGQQVNFKGTITLFTEFPPAIDTEKIIASLSRIASVSPGVTGGAGKDTSGTAPAPVNTSAWLEPTAQKPAPRAPTAAVPTAKNNMVVEKTPAGLRLSVRDIRFVPDSNEVLPSEHGRLDEIADVLKLAPDAQFLVEGHTAAVGKPEGEQKLSVERARTIAEELAKRGVNAAAFICRGWGGTRPIADNATDAGRAQNRRVEITILE